MAALRIHQDYPPPNTRRRAAREWNLHNILRLLALAETLGA
jgi:hypothetical protein